MTWSAIILRDGQPVTGPVTLTRWEAAGLAAPIIAGIAGGTISVAAAAIEPRPAEPTAEPELDPDPQLTIYDHPGVDP